MFKHAWLFLMVFSVKASAQWFRTAQHDLRIKEPSDQAFMIDLEQRAAAWIRQTNTPVSNGYRMLSRSAPTVFDTTDLPSAGSWRLTLGYSGDADTLVALALSMNYHYDTGARYRMKKIASLDAADEPRFVLPLSEYHNFMTRSELQELGSLIDRCIRGLAENQYMIGNQEVSSFSWDTKDRQHWPIFDEYTVRHVFERGALYEGTPVFRDPSCSDQLLSEQLMSVITVADTNARSTIGSQQPRSIAKIMDLELLYEPELLDWTCDHCEPAGFRSYSVRCRTLGIHYEGQTHSTAWVKKSDFVRYSNMGFLSPLLDILMANCLLQALD